MTQLQTNLLHESVEFLKAIHRYLNEGQLIGENATSFISLPNCNGIQLNEISERFPEEHDRTYLNVVYSNPPDDARIFLLEYCERLVERIEKEIAFAPRVENETSDTAQEVECSYLDMSGANTPKTNTGYTSASIVELKDQVSEFSKEDVTLPVNEENSYELTTDQILYDEYQQDVCYEVESASQTAPKLECLLGESQCPFGGLPASHLRLQQSPKHGTLFKQEKRLFFDQFKKYYVGLIGKWMLLYNSHNDLKPWQTIYIKGIKLDLSLNEQINEKHLFQIITQTDSKVHFLSPSFQDLNEWIVAIENNLIEKTERQLETGAMVQVARKLPLPPCPANTGANETDLHVPSQEDGIYEEPALYLKAETESNFAEPPSGYDTPKPCNLFVHTPEMPICKNKLELSLTSKKHELVMKNQELGGVVVGNTTPVKNWLKNKFIRSPTEPCEGKPSKKALKKLSFEELSLPEAPVEPRGSAAASMHPTSPKFTITTTPSNKGTKINMIISQLEANGQLNLLSKRLTETSKRYTWVAEEVPGRDREFGS